MPINIDEAERNAVRREKAWQDYWTSLEEAEVQSADSIDPKAGQTDKETPRKKRESLIGYDYQDRLVPFTPQLMLGRTKEHVFEEPIAGVASKNTELKGVDSKKGSVTDTYRWLWNRTKDAQAPTVAAETPKFMNPTETAKPEVAKTEAPKAPDIAATPKNETKTTKTKLQKTEELDEDLDKLLTDMNQLLQRIKECDADHPETLQKNWHRTDPQLFSKLIDAIKKQKSNRDEGCLTAQDRLMKLQEIKKTMHKIMQEIKEKQLKALEISSVAGWINIGLSIGIGLLFIGGIIASIVSGGAALAPAVGLASGLLGIMQGGNTAVKGYFDYEAGNKAKEHFGVKHERDEAQVLTLAELKKHGSELTKVTAHVEMQGQIARNRRIASRYNG